MIQLNQVTKIYDNNVVGVSDINLQINDGEFVFFVGSSGSGKSTLMRLFLKEIEPTKGTIVINDYNLSTLKRKEIPQFRRKMGVVFQDFRLLPNRTVYDNVAFAMEIVGTSSKDIRRTVPAVLALVGLQKKAKMFPNELSGGEQQRTAIARAIVNKPLLLLADEPTGNLDHETAQEIMQLLGDINDRGTTIIMVTHAKDIVDQFQKRVITLSSGVIIADVEKGGYIHED